MRAWLGWAALLTLMPTGHAQFADAEMSFRLRSDPQPVFNQNVTALNLTENARFHFVYDVEVPPSYCYGGTIRLLHQVDVRSLSPDLRVRISPTEESRAYEGRNPYASQANEYASSERHQMSDWVAMLEVVLRNHTVERSLPVTLTTALEAPSWSMDCNLRAPSNNHITTTVFVPVNGAPPPPPAPEDLEPQEVPGPGILAVAAIAALSVVRARRPA